MAARWTAEELKTFESLLAERVDTNLLKKHLPNRTLDAIHCKARKYDYGVKTVNGVTRLYSGKKTRVHKKKVEKKRIKPKKEIVGEPRTTTNSSTPTTMITFEQTKQNVSDTIIADSAHDFNGDALKHLYEDISRLLNSELYPRPKSITVTLENMIVTISGGAI